MTTRPVQLFGGYVLIELRDRGATLSMERAGAGVTAHYGAVYRVLAALALSIVAERSEVVNAR